MHALILAAGRGTRLGIGGDIPKCLTPVAGRPLLNRYLDVLDALSVPVTIVVGHGDSHIRAHVATRTAPPTLIYNARFVEGSIVSLSTGLASTKGDLLLLDGDVAFTPAMLEALLHSASPNALLVDIGTEFTDEQYMAGIDADRVVALKRGAVPGHELHGEWVGFAKLGTAAVEHLSVLIQQQIERGETTGGYEDALAKLLPTIPFSAIPTNGAAWVEIDFADDLARAEQLFANDAGE